MQPLHIWTFEHNYSSKPEEVWALAVFVMNLYEEGEQKDQTFNNEVLNSYNAHALFEAAGWRWMQATRTVSRLLFLPPQTHAKMTEKELDLLIL